MYHRENLVIGYISILFVEIYDHLYQNMCDNTCNAIWLEFSPLKIVSVEFILDATSVLIDLLQY
jgi:hypothetical protein